MEYNKIISVTGLPGLFELVSSKNDGALVRSLEDQTTKFVASRVHNFSHLESIEVYTHADNVNLVEVFHAMGKSAEKMPDEKDAAAIKKYFEKVFPEIDLERVYNSDMKKMIRWFGILKSNNIEVKLAEPEPEPEEADVEEVIAVKKETPAKAKKVAEPKAKKATAEAPKKETAPKAKKESTPQKKKAD
jgi:outer membrane biosynthesis protein TonB